MKKALPLLILFIAASVFGQVSGKDVLLEEDFYTGQLSRSDTSLSSGEYYDTIRISAERGQILTVDVQSEDFDTYLIVETPSGNQLENDDASGGSSTDSRLEFLSESSEPMELQITSYAAEETGNYSVTISRDESFVHGRSYGLFVGLTDYEEAPNDLEGCSDDAENLSRVLANQGVLGKGSMIVLTNARATGENIRQAITELIGKMERNDTFIFFFSGHGDRAFSDTSSEIDSCEESLCTYDDDDIFDDELVALLSTCPGNIILLIDACFAGGMELPENSEKLRAAFYSSQEYLESSVPDTSAGGYLSQFIYEALSGEADRNNDQILTLGEVRFFLNRQWSSSHGPAFEDNQFLVTDIQGYRNFMPLFILSDRGSRNTTTGKAEN